MMLNTESIAEYTGSALLRGESYVYFPPHRLLRPYLSAYTVSFISGGVMPEQYTVLPSASATLVYSVGDSQLVGGLRGVNTRACVVGEHANKYRMLLLIEFHPGGLFPFLGVSQAEMTDKGFSFTELDALFHWEIEEALLRSASIAELGDRLDRLFLRRLGDTAPTPALAGAMDLIIRAGGQVSNRALTGAVFYSEKHLQRLFRQQVGVGIKAFSRIVRVNRALRLLERSPASLARIAAETGYYDEAHFIREFRSLCGITPTGFRADRSVFYNETFKL